jgi:hypothetical protein
MSAKFKLFTLGFVIIIMLSGFWKPQSPPAEKKSTLAVMKIDGVWRVVNSADSSCTVIVNRNDKIIWTAEETDAEFHFNDAIFDTTDNEYYVKDGHKLQLKIKGDAKPGTYEYSVFCIADSVNAIGCSPPKIIVQ